MRKNIFLTMVVVSLFFSGCTIMKDTSLISKPNNKKVLVNFVRPSVFLYDGVNVNIWDGDTYIGSLGAGEIIQKEVEAGKHLFITHSDNWSYASGNLVAGKQYFLKPNPFYSFFSRGSFALGVAKSDDKRVDEWLSQLTPVIAIEEKRKVVEKKRKKIIKKAITNFEEGKVSRFATISSKNIHPILSEIDKKE